MIWSHTITVEADEWCYTVCKVERRQGRGEGQGEAAGRGRGSSADGGGSSAVKRFGLFTVS